MRILFLTIGEAPRRDIEDTYNHYFAGDQSVHQKGLLDDLSMEEAQKKLGLAAGESESLTSRFRDGRSIVMSHDKVEQALQETITETEGQTDAVCILCTSTFDRLYSDKTVVLQADKVTVPYMKQNYAGQRLGVLVPLPQQIGSAEEKWQMSPKPVFAAASPYHFNAQDFSRAAEELRQKGATVIILDCMGYSRSMKTCIEQAIPGIPVYQSNDILFAYISQWMKKEETANVIETDHRNI